MVRRKVVWITGSLILTILTGSVLSFAWMRVCKRLNVEKFSQIKRGMTQAEVERLLGGPPGDYGRYPDGTGYMTAEGYLAPPGSVEKVWCNDAHRFEIYFDQESRVVGLHERARYQRTSRWLGSPDPFPRVRHPAVSSVIFVSFIFCQANLVGMWGGFGRTHWMLRLIGVAMGAIFLWNVLGLGINHLTGDTFLVVFVTTSVVAMITWCARLFKVRLGRPSDDAASSREGFQFTIKHLLALTLVVAYLVTAGKLAPYLSAFARITVLGLCFVVVALTSIWAMLGLGRPALRIAPVLAIASASGWVGGFVIFHSIYTFWIPISVLSAVFFLTSLAVIRMCGYRLVAHR